MTAVCCPSPESAMVLELLMSLPEELALLDCSRLHRHLLQVYRYVSAPAHSKAAREALGALRAGLSAQVEAPAPAADHGGTSSQSGDADTLEACPPLNPFMVPVKLLMQSAMVLELLMSLPEELALLDCSRLHRHLLQVYRYVSAPAHSKAAREALGALRAGLSAQVEAPAPAADHGGTSSQSGDADTLEACPPLNPFMVPVKLLMRR
ncbi:unnamed protein product [Menidia menidia]|uniref:(Atlantic silverside) hypothetical protein n=1 Tax=Menidia menidia TaxID=238744 RepID=A0A8S4B8J5_9TELE|nr:unnamed protein product [Menidia menidia]